MAWHKTMGANVIQTFCVATNGYAWHKNGFVPEPPRLKHDFLPEVVKLGHKEGMKVMGYFCISSNPRWGGEHPDLSYGTPPTDAPKHLSRPLPPPPQPPFPQPPVQPDGWLRGLTQKQTPK